MSEAVNITGSPRLVLDVDGTTRYAPYTSGSGSSSLTFTYDATIGDIDLDGIGIASTSLDLNGGTVTDLNGNAMSNLTFTAPANMASVKVNYPSLSMNFVYDSDGRYTLNGTAYNDLTSLLTAAGGSFTRASTATYYNSSGVLSIAASGAPRFDYDPSTLVFKGLLIEENSSNKLQYSDDFSNALWQKINVTVSTDVTTSPDGAANADKAVSAATTGSFFVLQDSAVVSGVTYTQSFYVKAAGWNYVQLGSSTGFDTTSTWVNFNLSTGTIGNHGTGGTYGIQAINNGWYRIYLTATSTATSAAGRFYLALMPTDINGRNPPSATGDGTSGVYVYGGQFESYQIPTTYIPTASSNVTRNAETLIIPTGTWYNQNAGTFMNNISWLTHNGSNSPMFFRVDDTTNNNRWNLFYNQANTRLQIGALTAAASQGGGIHTPYALSGSATVSGAQSLNNTNGAFDGSISSLDTGWLPPPVTRLNIYGNDATKWNKELRYYPVRASDTQLQLLTQ
ncbi:MAG: hypothetical protein WC043_03425 [Pseudobdellovibrionaceae bacterium]